MSTSRLLVVDPRLSKPRNREAYLLHCLRNDKNYSENAFFLKGNYEIALTEPIPDFIKEELKTQNQNIDINNSTKITIQLTNDLFKFTRRKENLLDRNVWAVVKLSERAKATKVHFAQKWERSNDAEIKNNYLLLFPDREPVTLFYINSRGKRETINFANIPTLKNLGNLNHLVQSRVLKNAEKAILSCPELCNATLGCGNYGSVFVVEGLCHVSGAYEQKSFAIKICDAQITENASKKFHDIERDLFLQKFKKEGDISQMVEHMHAKEIVPVIQNDVVNGAYMVMKKLAGPTLFSFMRNNYLTTVDEVIEYCIQFSESLRKTIHDKKIVHGDIKSENVIVKPNGKMKIFDFGFSDTVDGNCNKGKKTGSPLYMAPEVFLGKGTSIAADYFAAGIGVLEICDSDWSQRECKRFSNLSRIRNEDMLDLLYSERLNKNFKVKLDHLFEYTLDAKSLTDNHLELIKSVIANLTSVKPEDRNLEKAISILKNIKFTRKLEAAPLENKHDFASAYQNAKKLNQEFKKPDTAKKQIDALNEALKSISKEEALQIFIDTLDIKALKNMRKKEEIIPTLNKIISDCETKEKTIVELQEKANQYLGNNQLDDIAISQVKNWFEEVKIVFNKKTTLFQTLDGVVKFDKKLQRLISQYNSFELDQVANLASVTAKKNTP